MAFDVLLADRVRSRLRRVAGVSERKMFGGLAFMTGGHLTVGVYGDGLIATFPSTLPLAGARDACSPATPPLSSTAVP